MHYMFDCYGPIGNLLESTRIVAENEAEAVAGAERMALIKRPFRYQVREVSRSGDRIVVDRKAE